MVSVHVSGGGNWMLWLPTCVAMADGCGWLAPTCMAVAVEVVGAQISDGDDCVWCPRVLPWQLDVVTAHVCGGGSRMCLMPKWCVRDNWM